MSIDITAGVTDDLSTPASTGVRSGVARRGLLGLMGGAGAVALAAAGARPAQADEPATGSAQFDVRDFGATGDGTTDDTAAFRNAVTAVEQAGGGTLHVPHGIYVTTGPIYLASNMVLAGDGPATIIRAAVDRGWTTADRKQGMINIVSETDVVVRDLELDQNSSTRELAHYVQYTMMLSDTADVLISNVTFRDAGLRPAITLPSGPILGLFTQEETESSVGGVPGGVYRVRVVGCRFLQTGAARVEFGIRVRSDWQSDRDLEEFKHRNEGHSFEDCVFEGEYTREAIELAGRVTFSNRVVRCHFTGQYSTVIDLDKGASYNVVAHNHIDRIRQPAKYVSDPNVLFFPLTDHGALYNFGPYENVGNIIAHNTVTAANTPESNNGLEAAIYIAGVRNSQVIGNVIDGYHQGRVGGGIRLDVDNVEKVLIQGNQFLNVNWGIRTPNGERPVHYQNTLHDVTIDDNTIVAKERCIWLSTFTPGGRNFRVTNNTLLTHSTSAPCVETGAQDAMVMATNALEGGSVGVRQLSPQAVLSSNVVRGTAGAAFDLRADTTLIGNVTRDADTADLVVAEGVVPNLVGNTFVGTTEAAGPRTTYGAGQPTTGTWREGDVVRTTAPSQTDPLGWICVGAGQPGRWAPLPRAGQR